MPQSLGAFYQCYKNPASFIRAIKSFQNYYPTNDIVVVSDGGHNYQEFCDDNNIHYVYKTKEDAETIGLMFNSYHQCLNFLRNLWYSFDHIKEDYILLIEDDVRVLKQHTSKFNYSINGCNQNEYLPLYAQTILRNVGYKGEFYYGACGGTILHKQFFKSISFERVEALLQEIKDHKELFASDLLISFIALYFGGNIGPYNEFAEMWYANINDLFKNNNIAFLHQYKNDYDKFGVYPSNAELTELKTFIQAAS